MYPRGLIAIAHEHENERGVTMTMSEWESK